ncbi:MAG: CPBP family intramembrane metalloprotease [Endomicrobia bacterium]|nr:CPBP family intramembrane metalloprotease [Endomicrobiia bacterium]MDW8055689.1 CPBP family intramembrane glutamic endopeptidase [Elusimicrobiota bacterium]
MTERAIRFLVFTFILSWLIGIGFPLIGGKWNSSTGILVAVLYMFCPLISVIVIERIFYHNDVNDTCGIKFKVNFWFLVAWLLPLVLSYASIGIASLFPGIEVSVDMEAFFERLGKTMSQEQLRQIRTQFDSAQVSPVVVWSLQSLVAGATINALVAFGEEIGWRGFLFNELSQKLNFWKVSTMTGFIWGVWHIPLILQGHNYPSNPTLGVLWMIIFCVLYSPIFNYIRFKSGSVIATSILHGTLNATYGISILFLKGGNEFIVGMLGLSGFVVLLIVDIIILLLHK